MQRMVVPLALVAMALAGCLGGDGTDDNGGTGPGTVLAPEWWKDAIPNRGNDDAHDHFDPLHHQGLTTPNFQTIGWDPLVTDYHGTGSGSYYCGEVSETEDRVLAAYNSFNSNVALVVFDVTDPTAPFLVGELVLPRTHTYDAALSDDGRFAMLATSPLGTTGNEGAMEGPLQGIDVPAQTMKVRPQWRDACGNVFDGPEDELPFASGVVLVDLRNPEEPSVADYRPLPALGAHSVSETTIDGVSYVIGSTTNLVHATSTFTFWTVEELPAGLVQLREYGAVDAQYPDAPQGNIPLINGHVDASIQVHPVTGQMLAYLANWNGGMVIVELVVPGVIVPVSQWTGFGAVHETFPLPEMWGDRHLTVIGQEGGSPGDGRTSLWVAVMDTTDPLNPTPVAWWTVPTKDVQWDSSLMYSTHYVTVVDETLFIAMYHGGVWAADMAEENWPGLPTVGVFVPDQIPDAEPYQGNARTAAQLLAPEILDVLALSDGTLVIADSYSGAYTVAFNPDLPVDVAPPHEVTPNWM